MIYILLILSVLFASCGRDHSTYRSDRDQLLIIRDNLRSWAHTCNGRPAQNTKYRGVPGCGIGDTPLYEGLGCLAGEERYCNPPPLTEVDSRDMMLGVIAYLSATNDNNYRLQAREYFSKLDNRLCFDACDRSALITDLMIRVGIATGTKLSKSVIESTLLTASQVNPVGYQLRLIADEIVIYKQLGVNLTRNIAKNLYRRQSCNPYFRYLAYGNYNIYYINTPPNSYKTHWLFSDACSEQYPDRSNGNMELYLVNLTLRGMF